MQVIGVGVDQERECPGRENEDDQDRAGNGQGLSSSIDFDGEIYLQSIGHPIIRFYHATRLLLVAL